MKHVVDVRHFLAWQCWTKGLVSSLAQSIGLNVHHNDGNQETTQDEEDSDLVQIRHGAVEEANAEARNPSCDLKRFISPVFGWIDSISGIGLTIYVTKTCQRCGTKSGCSRAYIWTIVFAVSR